MKRFFGVDQIQRALIAVLRISTVAALIWAIAARSIEAIVTCALAIGLVFTPELIKKRYRVELPVSYDLVIVAFIYSSLILGSAGDYYRKYVWWDAMLHTSSGVVLGFAGFLVLYTLYYSNKLKASANLIAFLAFCFALALGAIWEMFEYGSDLFLGTNMQPSLQDTMTDLIVDSLGAIFSVRLGYGYLKSDKKSWIVGLIKNFLEINPKIKA